MQRKDIQKQEVEILEWVLSELMAQLVQTSAQGLLCAEHHRMEPGLYLKLFICMYFLT